MIHSMTAFARVSHHVNGNTLCWEIRSVNHRHLDVSFFLPEDWNFLEPALRVLMANKIHRGKLYCHLKLKNQPSAAKITINELQLDNLLQLGKKLASSKQLINDLTLSTILMWPGIMELNKPSIEDLQSDIKGLFAKTLDELLASRQQEGAALKIKIQNLLLALQLEISNSTQLTASNTEQKRKSFLDRLNGLNLSLDCARVEQELALMIMRLDVNEELERISIHINDVIKIIEQGGVVGRRLDFLMQELNREANTLSSKSELIKLIQSAVEMKVLIEQMREQIQNIE